jgi:hypothetical protein
MVLVGAVLFVLLSVNMMLKGAHIYLLGAERGAPSHRQELSRREKNSPLCIMDPLIYS